MIPIHDLQENGELRIKVEKLDYLTGYDVTEPHRHNYFELFVFEKGDGVHDIDFQAFEIKSYGVHVLVPGQVHKVKRELNTNGYVIMFDTAIILGNEAVSNFLFDHMSYDVDEMPPTYHFDAASGARIVEVAEAMWKDFNSDNEYKTEFLKVNLNLICISCLRTIEQKAQTVSKNSGTYASFRRLLRNNFKEYKKVREYAAELHITEKKLNEIVRAKTGLTCSQLIYKQIILEAKRLLSAGVTSKEAAFELRFDDPAHFSKFFKSQTGISPGQFQIVQA